MQNKYVLVNKAMRHSRGALKGMMAVPQGLQLSSLALPQ